MSVQELVTLLIIGLAAGILSGLVGVGGGIILVPAFVFFLGYTQHQAQGTSLGVLCLPVVILAFINYYLDGKRTGNPIDLKVIGIIALGFIVGGYFGSKLAVRIDQLLLKRIFAVVLLYTAYRMLDLDQVVARWFKNIF
jgi:uncharacterized protein